jgi:hypothetical protein
MKFIKAKQVEAVKEDKDGVAGYRTIEKDSSHWQEAEAFLSAHTQVGDDDVEIDDDLDIDDE